MSNRTAKQIGRMLLAILAGAGALVGASGAEFLPTDAAANIADQAAQIAAKDGGLARLALYVAALSIGALVWLVGLMFRYIGRLTAAIEKIAGRPCLMEGSGTGRKSVVEAPQP